MNAPIGQDQDLARRRRSVRRTALAFGLIALSIYVAFILSGVIGR
ncbi:hypothetical protein [Xanthomonas sp. XNM01]|nr:hypothetical protein [Xanthomonas sp. XNM01]